MGDDLKTVPQDARYHNQNATKWCYASFVDYQRCIRLLGEGNSGCKQFADIYKTICPNSWISKWEEQLKLGTFPVDLPAPRCKKSKKK